MPYSYGINGNGWWFCPYGNKKMQKKIIYCGNYYGANQGCTGTIYHNKGIMATIVSADCRPGKALVLKKWKKRKSK